MAQNKTGTRSTQPHNSFKHFSLIFITLAVLLILGITYLALAKVTITLIPNDQPITYEFNLLITHSQNDEGITPNENNQTAQTDTPIIPGIILSKSLAVEREFNIQDGKTVDAQAQGTVIIYNHRPVSQTLVATTRLLTPDGILFRLKNKVIIPPNSQVEAEVYADQAGPNGNIGPTSFTIPGLSEALQKLVYAESKQPMRGGTKTVGILTQAEIDHAANELKKTSAADFLANYLEQHPDLTLIGTQIELNELTTEPALDSQTDSFNLTGQLNIKAVYADPNKIFNIAKTSVQKEYSNQTINLDPSSLHYQIISINPATQKAMVKVGLKGLPNLNSTHDLFDKDILIGFTEKDLKLYFSQFDYIKDVQIEFSPFWVKKVPILKDHIIIKIAE